jgi:hypothetical protein
MTADTAIRVTHKTKSKVLSKKNKDYPRETLGDIIGRIFDEHTEFQKKVADLEAQLFKIKNK